ncbi:MAG: hypothetical protein J6R99_04395, partial [Alphaproteobacteria bacterium]|nr:hypothetical protein [Alphaproteobacteria bacterium]
MTPTRHFRKKQKRERSRCLDGKSKFFRRDTHEFNAKKEYEESMAELEKAEKCRKNPLAPDCPEGIKQKCKDRANWTDPDCAPELEAYCRIRPTDTQYCGGNNGGGNNGGNNGGGNNDPTDPNSTPTM